MVGRYPNFPIIDTIALLLVFCVSSSWMRHWRDYVGWDRDWNLSGRPLVTDSPGPITNEDILEARINLYSEPGVVLL